MPVSRYVRGEAFLSWLRSAGIVPEGVRSVVMEAAADSVLTIYVEMYGSGQMIEADPPPELCRARVIVLDQGEAEPSWTIRWLREIRDAALWGCGAVLIFAAAGREVPFWLWAFVAGPLFYTATVRGLLLWLDGQAKAKGDGR